MNRKVGTSNISETDETDRGAENVAAQAGSRSDSAGESPRPKSRAKKSAQGKPAGGGSPGDVGQLLRGAYRQTVDEAIPDDLMDLLNKLE